MQTDLHVYCSHIHKQIRFLVTDLNEDQIYIYILIFFSVILIECFRVKDLIHFCVLGDLLNSIL